jgi:hypothetical protein
MFVIVRVMIDPVVPVTLDRVVLHMMVPTALLIVVWAALVTQELADPNILV